MFLITVFVYLGIAFTVGNLCSSMGKNTIWYKGLFVPFISISEFLLHKVKPDLSLVDISNNTALHLACSKVCGV